jgi:hypothetical protein
MAPTDKKYESLTIAIATPKVRIRCLATPLLTAFIVSLPIGLYTGDFPEAGASFLMLTFFGYLSFILIGLPLYLLANAISTLNFRTSVCVGLLCGLITSLICAAFAFITTLGHTRTFSLIYDSGIMAFVPCGLIGGIVFWFLGIRES